MKNEAGKKKPAKKVQPTKAATLNPKADFTKYYYWYGIGSILLLGIIIYSNSFQCAFHFDDPWIIMNNTEIHNLADIKSWLSFFPSRPVAIFTFALNYHFSKLDVEYYHYVNLTIHLITACLVWWLTLLIFSSSAIKESNLATHKKTIALVVALLFVSHPLATQAVTYITQRMAAMAAMFYLLSVALYVHARINAKGNRSKIIWFAVSFVAGILAVFTKENAFTLPFAILLTEFFFLRTRKISINFKDFKVYLIVAGFIALFAFLIFRFTFSIFKPIPPDLGRLHTVTPINYLLTEFSVIVKYIQLLFLPINQNLDYDFTPSAGFFEVRTLLSFLLLAAIFALGVFLYKKHRIISFGIFWFFLTLVIESSIIPLNDYIDEYRTYLPSFGFLIALVCVLYTFLWEKYKFLVITVFILMIGSNSILAFNMNKIWKDDLSLWNDVVTKSPNLARPYDNRGYAYECHGQLDKALADYSKAIELNPKFVIALNNRGFVYQKLQQWDKAVPDFSKVLELDSNHFEACFNRATVYVNLGEFAKAAADYSHALRINSKYSLAYSNRGFVYGKLGMWDKAVSDFTEAIKITPQDQKLYNNRGFAFSNLELFDKAIEDHSKAIELDPQFVAAYFRRGNAYMELEKWDKAIDDFNKAIALEPAFDEAIVQRDIATKNLNLGK